MEIRVARAKYKPSQLVTLFVSEAPPDSPERFFYFDDVARKDGPYIYLFHALYGPRNYTPDSDALRLHKAANPRRFQADGFFLIDALDEVPSAELASSRKRRIRSRAPVKVAEIEALLRELGTPATRVVLIKANVFDGLSATTVAAGLPLAHGSKIPFPGPGNQRDFLDAFWSLGITPESMST